MSTDAYVGYVTYADDNTQQLKIIALWQKWDGYPSGLGVELRDNWGTEKEARAFVDGGNEWGGPEEKSMREFREMFQTSFADYAYLFKAGEWHCYTKALHPYYQKVADWGK